MSERPNRAGRARVVTCGVLLLATTIVARAETSPGSNVPARCQWTAVREPIECQFYPKVAQPTLFAGPSGDSIYVDPRLRGEPPPSTFFYSLVADPDDLSSGAVRVRIYGLPAVVWMERRDLVRPIELRRVERCWPISRFGISNGDAPGGEITVREDGSGTLRNEGARARVHAWYLDGVYAVRQEGPSGQWRDWAWGNLDFRTRTVVDRANWGFDWYLEDTRTMGPTCAAGPVAGPLDAATWSARRARSPRLPDGLLGDWEPITTACTGAGTMTVERRRVTYALAPESSFDFAIRRAGWGGVLLEVRSEPRPEHVARYREITFQSSSPREPQILVEYGGALDASGHPKDRSVCWYVRRKGRSRAPERPPPAP